DERLHARSRAAEPPIAETDHDVVTRLQVTVDGIDDHRLLERPLVSLLVEPNLERLHGGGALTRHERARAVFGGYIVRALRIARLEQRTVRIELERRLEPRTVGHPRRADLVVEHDFGPFAGDKLVDVAGDGAEKRH